MADRTLRRSYDEANRSGIGMPQVNRTESESDDSELGGNSDSDNSVNGNGQNSERESDSTSRVGYVTIDPEKLGEYIARDNENTSDGSGSRKRRSDAGQKRGKRGTRETGKSASLSSLFCLVDNWANVLLKIPELELSDADRKKLVDALDTFEKYHEIPMLSAKRQSEINLILAFGSTYFPRMILMNKRIKENSKVRKAKNVTPINPQTMTQ